MTTKEKVRELANQGISSKEIANILGISGGTVCYHRNPKTKEMALLRKKNRNKKLRESYIHPLLNKEIIVDRKQVSWKSSELICMAKMIDLGYEIFIPQNYGSEIDFIAYKDKEFYKIQVKSASPTNKEYIHIDFSRNSVNYKRNKRRAYENINFYLIYDGTNIYKIDHYEGIHTMNLRYSIPSNGQIDGIHMAYDYILK